MVNGTTRAIGHTFDGDACAIEGLYNVTMQRNCPVRSGTLFPFDGSGIKHLRSASYDNL